MIPIVVIHHPTIPIYPDLFPSSTGHESSFSSRNNSQRIIFPSEIYITK